MALIDREPFQSVAFVFAASEHRATRPSFGMEAIDVSLRVFSIDRAVAGIACPQILDRNAQSGEGTAVGFEFPQEALLAETFSRRGAKLEFGRQHGRYSLEIETRASGVPGLEESMEFLNLSADGLEDVHG